MDGIVKIKDRILEEAEEEKQKILEKAHTQAQTIKDKYKSRAKEMLNDIIVKAKKEAEEKQRRILSMAKLENRKELLRAKQQMIDEVFNKAKIQLQNIPDEKYCDLLADMMVKSAITGDEEVIISESDKNRITQDFLSGINKALTALGKQGNLRFSQTSEQMAGGFKFRSKNLEVNNTFDSLINMEREELETEIAKILFEE